MSVGRDDAMALGAEHGFFRGPTRCPQYGPATRRQALADPARKGGAAGRGLGHLDQRELARAGQRAGDGRLLRGVVLALQRAEQPGRQAACGQRGAARVTRRRLQQGKLQRGRQLADAAQRLGAHMRMSNPCARAVRESVARAVAQRRLPAGAPGRPAARPGTLCQTDHAGHARASHHVARGARLKALGFWYAGR
jgi:hypothetical protein